MKPTDQTPGNHNTSREGAGAGTMTPGFHNTDGQGIAGHGPFFQATDLCAEQAVRATDRLRKNVDRRTIDLADRMDDVREHMYELEKDGQISIHRIGDLHEPLTVKTRSGRDKEVRPGSCGITSHAASAATSPDTPPRCYGS